MLQYKSQWTCDTSSTRERETSMGESRHLRATFDDIERSYNTVQ